MSIQQLNFIVDFRFDQYGTIFDHKWVECLSNSVDGTKLDDPFFELSINWRAAVNTYAFPWMMMKSLAGLWEGTLKHKGVTAQFVRQMAVEIPRRMDGEIRNMAKKRLGEVIQSLADDIQRHVDDDPSANITAEEMWEHFLDEEMWELQIAIWGSQRYCFSALYHAYENYFREVLSLKRQDPNYRVRDFARLVKDTTDEFGATIADECLGGDFLEISRMVRNALAHHGGKETRELNERRKVKDHGIPVESGFLQVMAPHNKCLIGALQRRVTILTGEALKYPECR